MHHALNEALLAQAPDALVYCDLEGRIALWNAAAATLFGHSAEQAVGRSLDIIIPERFRAAHWAGFAHAVASGHAKYHGQVLTTRAAHPDGRKLYVDLSFSLIRDPSGVVIGVLSAARVNKARTEVAAATVGKT